MSKSGAAVVPIAVTPEKSSVERFALVSISKSSRVLILTVKLARSALLSTSKAVPVFAVALPVYARLLALSNTNVSKSSLLSM